MPVPAASPFSQAQRAAAMAPAVSRAVVGAPATCTSSPSFGSSTTARPLAAAEACSASAWAVSCSVVAVDSRRLAASSAVTAAARDEDSWAWSRTRPVSQPVTPATAMKMAKVKTSAGWPITKEKRGSRKKKL